MSVRTLPAPTLSTRAEAYADRNQSTTRILRTAARAHTPERDRLVNEAVLLNMSIAESIAHRYANRGIDEDDLTQVAYMGLVHAARRYDPDRGKDFTAFAVPTITGEVKRHFRDHGWTIRPPRRVQELKIELSAARAYLAQRNGRTPSTAELAQHLHVGTEAILEAERSSECFTPGSIDFQGPDGDETPLIDVALGCNEAGYDHSEAIVALGAACRHLCERDRKIIHLRYYRGWTQQEIAGSLGVTQMQVSRLLVRIHRDLHDEIIGVDEDSDESGE